MICPLCAADVPVQARDCPACRTCLSEYAEVWYYPDAVFNEGVTALGREHYETAASLFAEVCPWRPSDTQAHLARATACSALGRHEEAVGVLVDAQYNGCGGRELDELCAREMAILDGPPQVEESAQPAVPAPATRTNIRKTTRAGRRRRR